MKEDKKDLVEGTKVEVAKPGEKISRRDALKKVGLFSTAVASLFLFINQGGCGYSDWDDYYDYSDYGDWANWYNNPNP